MAFTYTLTEDTIAAVDGLPFVVGAGSFIRNFEDKPVIYGDWYVLADIEMTLLPTYVMPSAGPPRVMAYVLMLGRDLLAVREMIRETYDSVPPSRVFIAPEAAAAAMRWRQECLGLFRIRPEADVFVPARAPEMPREDRRSASMPTTRTPIADPDPPRQTSADASTLTRSAVRQNKTDGEPSRSKVPPKPDPALRARQAEMLKRADVGLAVDIRRAKTLEELDALIQMLRPVPVPPEPSLGPAVIVPNSARGNK